MDWGGHSFSGSDSIFIVEIINWERSRQITGYFTGAESARRWLKANGFVPSAEIPISAALRMEFVPIFINAINSPLEMWGCVSPVYDNDWLKTWRGRVAYLYQMIEMKNVEITSLPALDG